MLLPAARLYAQVRAGRGETVTLEQADGFTARVDGTAAVVGMDPADFPALPGGPEGSPAAELDAAELADAIRATAFAVSGEAVRYALTGVLLDMVKDKHSERVHLVASDGKALSSWRMKGAAVRRPSRVIVPAKTMGTLADLAARAEKGAVVKVYVEAPKVTAAAGAPGEAKDEPDPIRVHFALPGAGVFSRLIDGHFPDHEAVIPANVPNVWKMDRKELADGLKAVIPATTDKTRAVRFTRRGAAVELFARSADVGEARATVGAFGSAEEQEVVLNPLYILAWLTALPKAVREVAIRMKDKKTATLWAAVGAAGHKYVVMPLTVNL